MQNYHPANSLGILDGGIPLQQLVNHFVKSSLPSAISNHSQVLNEVSSSVTLNSKNTKVITIMNELLDTVVRNSKNGEIHISADRYSDVIIFQIEERNNNNGYALSYSIGSIEPDAERIGGHISINGPQKKITTISFSFPVQAAA
jgi:hypothetical protein